MEQGALVGLLPDWLGDSFPPYALSPSRHLPPAKVRAFIDFAHERIAGSDRKRVSKASID